MEADFNDPIDVLARTLWGEARGEGHRGMHAVANVVMNRVDKPGWWGDGVISVCLKPYQFSCWLPKDPNYAKLMEIDERSSLFRDALDIAEKAVNDVLPDITDGADHYHAEGVTPNWSAAYTITTSVGKHIFYRSYEKEERKETWKTSLQRLWGLLTSFLRG